MANPRGQVELIETIGKGNYGYVYKGKLLKSNIIAAIKVVQLKEDELRETLLEMEILEACNHPNITKFMGCFLKGLDLWICMEFCGAGSLDSFYRTLKASIGENVMSCIFYEALSGLEYLHTQAALIHRDIKAGNLLVTTDGHIKLADFGVSAQLEDSQGAANTFIGTPYWMAPEVILTEDSDASYTTKADIWSIGITAIEIAEKNPPLSDIHPMRALRMIPNSEIGLAKPKNFSKPFVDFVTQCLTKNPEKRPTATMLLQHPWISPAQQLPRSQIIKELVDKVAYVKEKKKAGIEVVEDEDEDDRKQEVPQKVVKETVKYATQARLNSGQSAQPFSLPGSAVGSGFALFSTRSSHPLDLRDININEFPVLVNKARSKQDEIFDPTPIMALNMDIYTSAVLDEQYLLIGCERGLYFVDMTSDLTFPLPILGNIRFKQIQILPKYNVLIGLSGKRDHIRQYKLSSIRKLIRYLQGEDPHLLDRTDFSVSIQNAVVMEDDDTDEEYKQAKGNMKLEEEELVAHWTGDYVKVLDTRDSKQFAIEETETSVYLSVLFKQDLILFEWAKAPYNKFMKLKAFWLPEQPQFMSISQNGISVLDIYLGYTSELNFVSVEDSKVKEVRIDKDFTTSTNGKARWRTFEQIPFSDAKLLELLRTNAKNIGTVSGKGASFAGATMARNPGNVDRYFLGTYGRMTKVVDRTGTPMKGSGVGGWANGVIWTEPPVKLILRPLQHVICFGTNTIEVVDWKTADLRQRLSVDSGCTLKLLCSLHNQTIISIEKKKKGCAIYLLKENTAPPRTAGSLYASILEQASPNTLNQFQDNQSNQGNQQLDNASSHKPPLIKESLGSAPRSEQGRTSSEPLTKSARNSSEDIAVNQQVNESNASSNGARLPYKRDTIDQLHSVLDNYANQGDINVQQMSKMAISNDQNRPRAQSIDSIEGNRAKNSSNNDINQFRDGIQASPGSNLSYYGNRPESISPNSSGRFSEDYSTGQREDMYNNPYKKSPTASPNFTNSPRPHYRPHVSIVSPRRPMPPGARPPHPNFDPRFRPPYDPRFRPPPPNPGYRPPPPEMQFVALDQFGRPVTQGRMPPAQYRYPVDPRIIQNQNPQFQQEHRIPPNYPYNDPRYRPRHPSQDPRFYQGRPRPN